MDRRTMRPIRLKATGRRRVAEMLGAIERGAAPASEASRKPGVWTQVFLASGKPGKAPG